MSAIEISKPRIWKHLDTCTVRARGNSEFCLALSSNCQLQCLYARASVIILTEMTHKNRRKVVGILIWLQSCSRKVRKKEGYAEVLTKKLMKKRMIEGSSAG